MKGASELRYNWEKDLQCYTSRDKIEELCRLVNNKRRRGRNKKRLVIGGFFLVIALLLVLGAFNVLNFRFINVIIGCMLPIIPFLSRIHKIKDSSITKEEINGVICKEMTRDIAEKIRKTVEETASGIEIWLVLIWVFGIVVAEILRRIN